MAHMRQRAGATDGRRGGQQATGESTGHAQKLTSVYPNGWARGADKGKKGTKTPFFGTTSPGPICPERIGAWNAVSREDGLGEALTRPGNRVDPRCVVDMNHRQIHTIGDGTDRKHDEREEGEATFWRLSHRISRR